MKLIKLTQGQFAKVDDWRFEELSQFKWCAAQTGKSKCYRAVRNEYYFRDGIKKKKMIYMHRVVAKTPDGLFCDHVSHDTLDNQEKNLRNVTNQQNSMNRLISSNNSSGRMGVYWDTQNKKWRAKIGVNGKRVHLGLFENIDDAHEAYKTAAKKHFGEYYSGA